MKIVTTTVAYDGYHTAQDEGPKYRPIGSASQRRLDVLREAIAKSHARKADLLCLPGGYFYYASSNPRTKPLESTEPQLVRLIEAIKALVKDCQLAVAVGLDLAEKDPNGGNERDVRDGTLPWYALCWSPSNGRLDCWNQRSITSAHTSVCSLSRCNQARTMQVQGGQVEILMCGDIFNSRIRDAITQRHQKPLALVDMAHTNGTAVIVGGAEPWRGRRGGGADFRRV